MNRPTLTHLRITEMQQEVPPIVGLRASFSNDRHFRAVIAQPGGQHQVAKALRVLADLIEHDPVLQFTLDDKPPAQAG